MSADVDPEVKGQAKPAGNIDPEVERLARLYMATWAPAKRLDIDPGELAAADSDHVAAVAAVLADLRERYVLVPREGAEIVEERQVWMPNPMVPQWRREATWETHYDVPRRRRFALYRPWEVTSAPLSAQNGPDDSQGHPDRDDA